MASRFDADSDGKVDANDLLLFHQVWQMENIPTPTPSGTSTHTPTPTLTPTQAQIPPYILSFPSTSALVGETYKYQLVAADPNGDTLSYQLLSGPSGMVVSATGWVTWTPAQVGTVDVSLGVSDGITPQVSQDYAIHVGLSQVAVSALISSLNGGVVEVTDPNSPLYGARVEVPPSAIPEDASVIIRSVSNPNLFLPNALPMEIAGLDTTSSTVTIDVPYDPGILEMFGDQPDDLLVYVYEEATDEWIPLPKSQTKIIKIGLVSSVVSGVNNSRKAIVAAGKTYHRLFLQNKEIIAIKGALGDFYKSTAPKRRLMFIHGFSSDPQTFQGSQDLLPPSGSLPQTPLQQSLWNSYDSIVAYQYPSAHQLNLNSRRLVEILMKGYAESYAGAPPSNISDNPNFSMDIIAHSMGGMLARWFVEKQNGMAVVDRLITIASPHNGFGSYDNFSNRFGYVFPPLAALRVSFPGLVQLANGLTEGDQFLGALNQTNPPQVSTRYYCLAGLKPDTIIPNSDGVVGTESALFLNLPTTREKLFEPANENFSHSNLHVLASTNGVGTQVLSWLQPSNIAPTRTPTPVPPPFTGDEIIIEIPGLPANRVQLEMVRIPAGSFQMGIPADPYNPSQPGERGGSSTEMPQHWVNIENDFYMGKYEVTVAQFRQIVGRNPFSNYGDDYPAGISWYDAREFIRHLGICYQTDKFRMPTEAEWEYACRGGPQVSVYSPWARFHFGHSYGCLDGCEACPERAQYMWWCGNAGNQPHPVGMLLPNQLGLFDMHGNVSEWCQDYWHGNYDGAPTDGSAWESPFSSYRVLRGGSYNFSAGDCRSAYRSCLSPNYTSDGRGFRLVRTP